MNNDDRIYLSIRAAIATTQACPEWLLDKFKPIKVEATDDEDPVYYTVSDGLTMLEAAQAAGVVTVFADESESKPKIVDDVADADNVLFLLREKDMDLETLGNLRDSAVALQAGFSDIVLKDVLLYARSTFIDYINGKES